MDACAHIRREHDMASVIIEQTQKHQSDTNRQVSSCLASNQYRSCGIALQPDLDKVPDKAELLPQISAPKFPRPACQVESCPCWHGSMSIVAVDDKVKIR